MQMPIKASKGIWYLGAGIASIPELPDMSVGKQTQVLCNKGPLMTESSLQPVSMIILI